MGLTVDYERAALFRALQKKRGDKESARALARKMAKAKARKAIKKAHAKATASVPKPAKQRGDFLPYTQGMAAADFYRTREWLQARYEVFELHGPVCQCCGATRKQDIIQVDHIKPRSLFPELELVISNLQVLCRSCNIGKLNKSTKDWR